MPLTEFFALYDAAARSVEEETVAMEKKQGNRIEPTRRNSGKGSYRPVDLSKEDFAPLTRIKGMQQGDTKK